MFILTVSGQRGRRSICCHRSRWRKSIVSLFEEEDDAERYAGLLEAEDYPEMSVVEIEEEVAISACYKL